MTAPPPPAAGRRDARFSAAELRALRPWAAAFEGAPLAHIRLIGAALEAIAPLVETAEQARRAGRSELETFDDVVGRGPIERLILSEFVWAQASPAEFIRRVAENEALRRRPIYNDPADDRAVVLLLQSGPAMLGRRRLMALGALFALGLSARRRGVRLLWSATGFTRAPIWLDGLDRRGLARFVHQTADRDWDGAKLRARLAAAPAPAAAAWVVDAAGGEAAELGDAVERLEIDEIWPALGASKNGPARPARLRAALFGAGGLRREATIPAPPERLAAATLRAPFRAPGRAAADADADAAARGWAPDWIALETEGGAMLARLENGLALRPPRGRAIVFRPPDGGELLGARALGGGRSVVVWRAGGVLSRAFFDPSGRRERLDAGKLSAEHPLVAGAVAPSAAPPALRLGRGETPSVAAPDGSVHQLSSLDEWAAEGLDAAPHPTLADLRVVAWAQSWVLAEPATETRAERGLVLHQLRSGRRLALEAAGGRPIAPPVRRCLLIGATGGALIADAAGVLWLGRRGGPPPRQPELPPETQLLSVRPGAHEAPGAPAPDGRWSFEAWTPEQGLLVAHFSGEGWRIAPLPGPWPLPRPLAMVRAGKVFYAAIAGDDGAAAGADGRPPPRWTLMEFRRGDEAATPCAETRWLQEAACVQL